MFVKNCPTCGKEQKYKSEYHLKRAIKKNTICRSCTKKGNTYTKGKKLGPHSEEHKRKLSIAATGRIHLQETKRKISIANGGDGVSGKVWDMSRLMEWKKEVKERDDYICQHCYLDGIPNTGEIEAHHIVPKSKFPQYAYDVDNGQSLCKECHIIEHHKRPNEPWRAS